MPFDPTIDLSSTKATYELSRALEIAPEDGYTQYFLSKLFQMRGMDEPALPLLERFVRQPNKNLSQRAEKARAADRIAALRSQLGLKPPLQWANLSELEQRVTALLSGGWVSTAADVMESAYPTESRPWAWADRLAILRLHLGQPARARAIWLGAARDVPAATRAARIGATYLVEDDFPSARKSYREALTLDPHSFEAHYGLAVLEQDAGRADDALAEGRLAVKAAASENSRASARLIVNVATPYAKPAKAP